MADVTKGAIRVRDVRAAVGRPQGKARRSQPAAPAPVEGGGTLLEEYLRTLNRHRLLLLLFAGTGVLLALLTGFWTLPVYATRTSLDIRALNTDFMNMRSVAPTGDNAPAEADTNLQTQIKLLQSDTLVNQTMDRMLAQPHPETIDREDLFSRVRRALHVGHPAPILYRDALGEAAQHFKVKPLGLTRLVEISCEAWNAKLAADFCNSLISTYQQQDLQVRSQEATEVSGWLTRQVADIRQRVQQTQDELEKAVGNNGLRLSQANTSIGEQRLQALQGEVVKAQSDRIAKEAAADEDRNAASAPGTLAEVQQDPAHRAYEIRQAELRSQLAALTPTLTANNPKVIALQQQIHEAEAGLQSTANNSVARDHNDLQAARHREQLLTLTYNAELATVSSDLQQSAKVSLLRSEMDSEQQLYQTLLQRAREAGFASAMQAATIRVIDPAQVPRMPASPRRSMEFLVGLLLGLAAGMVTAFYRERTQNVFRLPGELTRMLDIQELGVIPAGLTQGRSFATPAPGGLLRMDASQGMFAPGPALDMTRWDEKFSLAAEAYSNATFSILQAGAGRSSRTYAVSSPKVGEGKTTITSNLGVALSKAKLRVLLIDGDLRRPSLHKAFGLTRGPGMREALRNRPVGVGELVKAGLLRETAFPNLSVITAGSGDEDSVELLHSERLPKLLHELSENFDIVLVDTPPALHMVDTRMIARACDGVILVVRASVTTLDEAAKARDQFDSDGVHLVGTILNDFDPQRQGYNGYYKAYEQYQKPDGGKGPEKAVTAA